MKRYAVLFKLIDHKNHSICGSDAIVPLDARKNLDSSIFETEDAIKRKEKCIGNISGFQIMSGDIKSYRKLYEEFNNDYPIQPW